MSVSLRHGVALVLTLGLVCSCRDGRSRPSTAPAPGQPPEPSQPLANSAPRPVPAAPAVVQPLAQLTRAWHMPAGPSQFGSGTSINVFAHGERVLVVGPGSRATAVDRATGAIVKTTRERRLGSYRWLALVGDQALVTETAMSRTVVMALAGDSLTPRWRTPIGPCMHMHARGGDQLILARGYCASGQPGPVAVALDIDTGAQTWTLEEVSDAVRLPVMRVSADRARVYFFDGTRSVVALDLATGGLLWRRRLPDGSCGFELAGSRLVVAAPPAALMVLDAENGRSERRIATGPVIKRCRNMPTHRRDTLTARGDRVYLLGDTLQAFSLNQGRRLWQARGKYALAGYSQELLASDDAVYVHEENGVLSALDAGTGQRVWHWSMATAYYSMAILEPPKGGSEWLVTHNFAGDVSAFARGTQAVPEEVALITGAVELQPRDPNALPIRPTGLTLEIGTGSATVDERGRFYTSVRGRGELVIRLASPPEFMESLGVYDLFMDKRWVTLDGSGAYDVGTLRVHEDEHAH